MYDKNVTIGDIVTDIPQAMTYFKEIGIDYCCGGSRLLNDVIGEYHLNINDVINHLSELKEKQRRILNNVNFTTMTSQELIDYIVEKYHNYLKKYLPLISTYLNAVIRAHGINHPELFEIGKVYGLLQTDLGQHIIKEETIVFPAIISSDLNTKELLKMIQDEHEEAGELLRQLRTLTSNYQIPNDACETYKQLITLLEELEDNTHTHIHLENNILMKGLL